MDPIPMMDRWDQVRVLGKVQELELGAKGFVARLLTLWGGINPCQYPFK